MDVNDIPSFGYLQPSHEVRSQLLFHPMADKKQGKRGKRPASAQAMRLRREIAENIEALIEHHYPLSKFNTVSDQQKQVAKDVGVSWSSVQRAINPHEGLTLDVLADLAVGLRVEAHELLNAAFRESLPARPISQWPKHIREADSDLDELQRRRSRSPSLPKDT